RTCSRCARPDVAHQRRLRRRSSDSQKRNIENFSHVWEVQVASPGAPEPGRGRGAPENARHCDRISLRRCWHAECDIERGVSDRTASAARVREAMIHWVRGLCFLFLVLALLTGCESVTGKSAGQNVDDA